jgi:hypothetical protein
MNIFTQSELNRLNNKDIEINSENVEKLFKKPELVKIARRIDKLNFNNLNKKDILKFIFEEYTKREKETKKEKKSSTKKEKKSSTKKEKKSSTKKEKKSSTKKEKKSLTNNDNNNLYKTDKDFSNLDWKRENDIDYRDLDTLIKTDDFKTFEYRFTEKKNMFSPEFMDNFFKCVTIDKK